MRRDVPSLPTPVLASWRAAPAVSDGPAASWIAPDGCRDLICHQAPGAPPRWFVSDLDDHARTVVLAAGHTAAGWRLRPGTAIATDALLASLRGCEPAPDVVQARLADFAIVPAAVAEAIAALTDAGGSTGEASSTHRVTAAAADLGVAPRTLQRLLLAATGRPPSFWLMLVRARRAARALAGAASLAAVAHAHGYADQAHMSRDLGRWFGLTPTALRRDPARVARLADSGCD